jgi:hypothetical protein
MSDTYALSAKNVSLSVSDIVVRAEYNGNCNAVVPVVAANCMVYVLAGFSTSSDLRFSINLDTASWYKSDSDGRYIRLAITFDCFVLAANCELNPS